MTYRTGIAACIKAGGKVLREVDDSVLLPFGSEYSLLIKNLKTRRVMVKVSIDGTDATDGTSLVINPNSEIELERFIRSGNLGRGNRFKFIQRTEAIEKNRGIKTDDGIVRIEYWTEKAQPVVQHVTHYHHYDWPTYPWYPRPWYPSPWYPSPYWERPYITCGGNIGSSCGTISGSGNIETLSGGTQYNTQCNVSQALGSTQASTASTITTNAMFVNDAGITVPGSESTQQFSAVAGFDTEAQSDVIVLKLRGQVGGKVVPKPVTVKTKSKCSTCGRVNKGREKFCGRCGTALELF